MPAAEVRFLPQDPEFVSLEDEIIDGKPFSRTLLKCSVVAESEGRTVTACQQVEIKSPREASALIRLFFLGRRCGLVDNSFSQSNRVTVGFFMMPKSSFFDKQNTNSVENKNIFINSLT